MQVYGLGAPNPVQVPDQPASSPPALGPFGHGELPAATQPTTSDHVDFGLGHANIPGPAFNFSSLASTPAITVDAVPAAAAIQWFAHSDAPALAALIPSVVIELPAGTLVHAGPLGDSGGLGDGGASVFRGGDTIASLTIDTSGYADHGWFIVPSASAEYGDAHFDVAGADGFVFHIAAGEFTTDWFLV